jgi:hypothetical protein
MAKFAIVRQFLEVFMARMRSDHLLTQWPKGAWGDDAASSCQALFFVSGESTSKFCRKEKK